MIGHRLHLALLAASTILAAACSDSPAAPPAVTNTPPIIESIRTASDRVEADASVQITATVKDAESAVNGLTYTWSSAPGGGAFSGTGSAVSWRAPKGQRTPDLYTITLTVSEAYTSAGQAKVNTVSSSVGVRYNDSVAETTALARQFLTDYGTFTTTGAYCVRNFSDSCRGKAEEREQIDSDRQEVHIFSAAYKGPPAVKLNATVTEGSVEGPCEFVDMDLFGPDAGRRRSVNGTCVLTAVYENYSWYLCDSFFRPPYANVYLRLRDRHRYGLFSTRSGSDGTRTPAGDRNDGTSVQRSRR